MKETKTIILAAGQGSRMHSEKSKVLHEICGDSLLGHVILANQKANIEKIAVIVGVHAEEVKLTLPKSIQTYYQAEQLGTGHAVMQALPFIEDFEGHVLVLVGDAPLVRAETLRGLIEAHEKNDRGVTVLTAWFEDPTGYGRMVKDGDELIKIVEEKDADPTEKAIHEINSGMYCFDAAALRMALSKLTVNNVQNEYYLTDAVEIIRNSGRKVGTFIAPDREDIAAVNSQNQLAQVGAIMQKRINEKWMAKGVTIVDPSNTYIESSVFIGKDTLIEPCTMITGFTVIGDHCVIGQNSRINNAEIKDYAVISASVVEHCRVDACSEIGPFAVLSGFRN